jgi:excisionase family DNA binding protein
MIVIDGREMVDIPEAARLVRRSPETIRRWVWSGSLPSVRSGRKHYVTKIDLLSRAQGASGGDPSRSTLAEWAVSAPAQTGAGAGASAADLVLADRDRRAGR